MNENQPTNVQLDANGKGTVTFATDVVATIAGLAATEVEGVASMVGSSSSGLAEIFKRGQNTRSLTRGVRVELNDNQTVSIHLTIIVDYGAPVPRVAKGIQENVKKTIENMSGLEVTEVNVHVHGVSFEKENRAAAEIEAQQRLMLQKEQEEKQAKAAEAAAPAEAEAPAAEPAAEEEDEGEYVLDLGDEPEMDEEPAKQEADEQK
jgi:uncharacterized alkaline shock family protein YloU